MLISTAIKPFGDLGPLIAVLFHEFHQENIFIFSPGSLFEFWLEMVEPHLSAAFEHFEHFSLGRGEKFIGDDFPFDFGVLLNSFGYNSLKKRFPFRTPSFCLKELKREKVLNLEPESQDRVLNEDGLEESEVLFSLNR